VSVIWCPEYAKLIVDERIVHLMKDMSSVRVHNCKMAMWCLLERCLDQIQFTVILVAVGYINISLEKRKD